MTELYTIREVLYQFVVDEKDEEFIEALHDNGLSEDEVSLFLELDDRPDDDLSYGTFWKRFTKYVVEERTSNLPSVTAIFNPMRLIIQNLEEPLEIQEPKIDHNLDAGYHDLTLSHLSYVDQKRIKQLLARDSHIIELQNAIEINIQQIATRRGVDVVIASINEDISTNQDTLEIVPWVSVDAAFKTILHVNLDLLSLLQKDSRHTRADWILIMRGLKNEEAIEVQASGIVGTLAEAEIEFVYLRDIGIVRVFLDAETNEVHLFYCFGWNYVELEGLNHLDHSAPLTPTKEENDVDVPPPVPEVTAPEVEEAAAVTTTEEEFDNLLPPPPHPLPKDLDESVPPKVEEESQEIVNCVPPPIPAAVSAPAEEAPKVSFQTAPEIVYPNETFDRDNDDTESLDSDLTRSKTMSDVDISYVSTPHSTIAPVSSTDTTEENANAEADEPFSPVTEQSTPMTVSTSNNFSAKNSVSEDATENNSTQVSPRPREDSSASLPKETTSSSVIKEQDINPYDFEERDDMTPKERKELKKRREEYEKRRKLQEFLRVEGNSEDFLPVVNTSGDANDTVDTNAPAPGTQARKKSVKDRFLTAQQAQQQQESERLAKFKNDPTKRINTENSTIREARSKWTEKTPSGQPAAYGTGDTSTNPASTTTATGGASEQSKNKLRNKWEEALEETKNTEINRFQNTKLRTIAQFRVTQGSGIVKKRVGDWEELFVQIAATAEQLEQFLTAARELSNKTDEYNRLTSDQLYELQQDFIEACLIPEDFLINDTHIYPSTVFNPIVHSYLKRILNDNKTKHISLCCGVYGDTQSSKPPIDVFAAAIKTAQGKIYVALTVKAALGKDLDISVYGLKKVNVFAKENDLNIFEKILNILPMPGWENWITEGSYDDMKAIVNYQKTLIKENSKSTATPTVTSISAGVISTGSGDSHMSGGKGLPVSTNLDDFAMDAPEPEEPVNAEELQISKIQTVSEAESPEKHNLSEEVVNAEPFEKQQKTEDEATPIAELPPPPPIPAMSPPEDEVNSRKSRNSVESASSLPPDEGDGTWKESHTPAPAKSIKPTEDDENADENQEIQDDTLLSPSTNPNNNDLAAGGFDPPKLDDSDEDDDNDSDGHDYGDDDDQSGDNTYHFERSPVLVSSTIARSFLPSSTAPNAFSKSVYNISKYAWPIEAEKESDLPSALHGYTHINLRDMKTIYCTSNFLVIASTSQSSTIFTGTLQSAVTETTYVLEGNKVFEWIRGAAASGWCWKWPMKTQNMGRLRKRFFVLRDHILSYHKIKPSSEEELATSFSANTSMHITDNSTVSIGRKFLQRCLIVNTPFDTLWLKMNRKDFAGEAVKWITEINKAIQFLNRSKLIMSKPRIESKWYHESPNFDLVNVDVVSIDDSFCKLALFCLKIPLTPSSPSVSGNNRKSTAANVTVTSGIEDLMAYSLDIASSDTPRLQVEILNEDESMTLPCKLTIAKVYGDYVLFGGNKGYLSIGIMSRTRNTIINTPSNTTANSPSTAANNVSNVSKRVVFTIPLKEKLLETIIAENMLKATSASNDSTGSPQSGGTRPLSPSDPTNSLSQYYPHSVDSEITAMAVAYHSSVFAVADSQNLISLWYLARNKRLCNFSSNSTVSNPNGLKKVLKRLKLNIITVINIKQFDSFHTQKIEKESKKKDKKASGNFMSFSSSSSSTKRANNINNSDDLIERIVKMRFLANDTYLLISTNRRMILLAIQYTASGIGYSHLMEQNFEESYSRGTSMDVNSFQHVSALKSVISPLTGVSPSATAGAAKIMVGFSGWVELDRAVPRCYGAFDFFISDESDEAAGRKIVQWRCAEIDDEEDNAANAAGSRKSTSFLSSGTAANKSGGAGNSGILRKCYISRIAWSEPMFQAALAKLKPCPLYVPGEGDSNNSPSLKK